MFYHPQYKGLGIHVGIVLISLLHLLYQLYVAFLIQVPDDTISFKSAMGVRFIENTK